MGIQSSFSVSKSIVLLLACGQALAGDRPAAQPERAPESAEVVRGRYLVQISGCNDCHTQGYTERSGKIDETRWLAGSSLGWSGPWGTTYPANLRLVVENLGEKEWLVLARSQLRPPMPWFNLRAMNDADLGAIYHYLKHLGPTGELAPAYVPPDRKPTTPIVTFGSAPP